MFFKNFIRRLFFLVSLFICGISLAQTAILQTNYGDITIQLDPQHAPKSVQNFLDYAKSGFYNGTIFHRVINGFMIQGGGFDPSMNEKPTKPPILNEADNGLKNNMGSVAMARTSDPNSATAQFFINVANNDFLNFTANTPEGWGYAVFGNVTQGMDVVNKIAQVQTNTLATGMSDVPVKPVIIEKVIVN